MSWLSTYLDKNKRYWRIDSLVMSEGFTDFPAEFDFAEFIPLIVGLNTKSESSIDFTDFTEEGRGEEEE